MLSRELLSYWKSHILLDSYNNWKGGAEVEKLKQELKKSTGKDIQINIFEAKDPEIDAKLIGDSIAQQLRARISHRRAMKQAIASAMRVGAKGIKVKVSGRIGGAEMARSEQYKEGRTPLHTIRADIDYAICESQTIYGKIGVKVWAYKGEVVGKRNLSLNVGNKNSFKVYSERDVTTKRTKFRKKQKGRVKGIAQRGHTISFGSLVIKSLEAGWITSRQIEAARIAVTRKMKREGQVWIRIFPDKPVTKKPAEVRMGKGKVST